MHLDPAFGLVRVEIELSSETHNTLFLIADANKCLKPESKHEADSAC